MVVLLNQDFAGISREDAEALSNDMGVRENPPAGLIAHVVTETANGVHVVDIWESKADFQTFNEERLMPATKAVAQSAASMDGFGSPCPRKRTTSFGGELNRVLRAEYRLVLRPQHLRIELSG